MYPLSYLLLGQPHTPYPSYPPSHFMPTFSPATESPFTLVLFTGNISVCAVCLSHHPKPAKAPYDMLVRHPEWRSFTDSGNLKSKFAPTYYHVSLLCIQKNWPVFHVSKLLIQPDTFQKLNDIHIHFLHTLVCSLWFVCTIHHFLTSCPALCWILELLSDLPVQVYNHGSIVHSQYVEWEVQCLLIAPFVGFHSWPIHVYDHGSMTITWCPSALQLFKPEAS